MMKQHQINRDAKIHINIKNLSSSPRKENYRTMSPQIIVSQKILKVKTVPENITRIKNQSPIRISTNYNINNDAINIRTINLLVSMKNKNISPKKLLNEFNKSKSILFLNKLSFRRLARKIFQYTL